MTILIPPAAMTVKFEDIFALGNGEALSSRKQGIGFKAFWVRFTGVHNVEKRY